MKRLKGTAVPCALALILVSIGALGQVTPDAQTVLTGVDQAYSAVAAFQGQGTMKMETTGPGMQQRMQGTISLSLESPGKMRMEMNMAGSRVLLISDGHALWMYMPSMNVYSKMNMPAHALGQNSQTKNYDLFVKYRNLAGRASAASVLRSQTLSLNGQPADCWVLHVHYKPLQASGTAVKGLGVKPLSSEGDLWVDKANYWVLREDTNTRFMMSGAADESNQSLAFDKVTLNPGLEDSLFVFSPPAGARELNLSALLPSAGAPK